MRIRSLFTVCCLAAPLAAQPPAGSVGIYFDSEGTQRVRTAPGFELFDFHAIGFELGGIAGWEARISFSTASWHVLGFTCNPVLACDLVEITDNNFIVGLGTCLNGSPRFRLITYTIGYLLGPTAPSDLAICLGPSTPSSFGGVPGYADCDIGLHAFTYAQPAIAGVPEGCAIVNPSVIAMSAQQLGAVKARW